MKNYKIKVKDKAESKEALELFFQLGCEWRDSREDITNLGAAYIYADDGILTFGWNYFNFKGSKNKELILQQLRDLVAQSKKDQGLISGPFISANEAFEAWQNDFDVEFIYNNEATLIDADTPLDVFKTSHGFRLKPTTLTVNAELPKPSNTTLHNQNYSVTYEFKTREDRNAFVEALGGNNS